jgi:hypothetical protein
MLIVHASHSFEVTLATFDVLTNDERTRSFLVCEVGFGYNQVSVLFSPQIDTSADMLANSIA